MASYYDQLKELAESIGSDGCTGVTDIHIECCWEHDWTYVTGTTPRGIVVDKEYADRRFRDCIQARMSLRWFSPFSWIRWIGVTRFGIGIWSNSRTTSNNLMISNYSALNDARNSRIRILQELQNE